MKLKDKVAQLFMCGFQDDTHLEKLLEIGVGGYILFNRNCENIESIRATTHKIYKKSKFLPWISIDQEGGPVTRIKNGVTRLPSQMAIAATGDYQNAYKCAEIIGKELSSLGINMNLAPVVDVNNNPDNPVINLRSFSSNPEEVALYSEAALKGYQKHLMPVAKHFPGHGDTWQDSHTSLPKLNHDRSRLDKVELVPYKYLIPKGLSTIMVSHVLYDQVDPNYPSSMSKSMIAILREDLSYDGMIMTDCMEMDAIRKNYTVEHAAVQCVLAGIDMILYSHTLDDQMAAIDAVIKAVEDGLIDMHVIDHALVRIHKFKKKADIREFEIQDKNVEEIFEKAITPVKELKSLDLNRSIMLLPEADFLDKYDFNIHKYYLNQDDYSDLFKVTQDFEYVIFGSSHLKRDQKIYKALQKLETKKLILVALESPYDIQLIKNTYASYCLYGYNETMIDTLIKVLFHHGKANGILPIALKENEND